ncbi:hypothetical protein HZC07_02680 [Candidatus Micrarchaeota archaeon]|nr:hypothetical protein [Candidatus Micrarchaeota archaeon]
MEVSTAFLVEGEKRTPVRGFMLSGNVFDLFSSVEFEKKLHVFGRLASPRLAFDKFTIVT